MVLKQQQTGSLVWSQNMRLRANLLFRVEPSLLLLPLSPVGIFTVNSVVKVVLHDQ